MCFSHLLFPLVLCSRDCFSSHFYNQGDEALRGKVTWPGHIDSNWWKQAFSQADSKPGLPSTLQDGGLLQLDPTLGISEYMEGKTKKEEHAPSERRKPQILPVPFEGAVKGPEITIWKGKAQRSELRRNLKKQLENACARTMEAVAGAEADTSLCLESNIMCLISIKCHRSLLQHEKHLCQHSPVLMQKVNGAKLVLCVLEMKTDEVLRGRKVQIKSQFCTVIYQSALPQCGFLLLNLMKVGVSVTYSFQTWYPNFSEEIPLPQTLTHGKPKQNPQLQAQRHPETSESCTASQSFINRVTFALLCGSC